MDAAGEVHDLKVRKDPAGRISLVWNPYAGMKYNIAEGDLDALRQGRYTHRRKECGILQPAQSLTPQTADAYYLVTPQCPAGSEGSFGRASTGREIPHAVGYCLQLLGGLP